MKLIIAETGQPPEDLGTRWGTYPDMFMAMFESIGVRFDVETVNVEQGHALPSPAADQALLITGSPKGAYDSEPWIASLEASIRQWAEAERPVLGICFGHQVIAQAFGAPVKKSSKGWGVGVHTYDVVDDVPWEGEAVRFSCAVSHQDQVQAVPEGFRRIAGSAFCPFGALAHNTLPVLTFQMHPEFDHGFAEVLMNLRSDRIPEVRRNLGAATLKNPSNRADIARWMAAFIEQSG